MLYLLGYSGQGQLRIFGKSNEKYHVRGGNDQIPAAPRRGAARARSRPDPSWSRSARNADGTYRLDASSRAAARARSPPTRSCSRCPFSILRNVDYSQGRLLPGQGERDRASWAWARTPSCTSSSTSRLWNTLGQHGETFADTGYQNTWEVTAGAAGTAGILVDYTGGNDRGELRQRHAQPNAPRQFLAQIEPVLPGITSQWNGSATVDYWPGNPWTKGSYSYWKVGQYTKFAGAEGEQEGTCHFAGEHTSIEFQGYLNGGVESGERAAAEDRRGA